MALAAAIVKSLKNPSALQSQIDRAEARALQSFTANRMVESTLSVYDEVLQASKFVDADQRHRRAA
jgi:hypothetical protein